MQLLKENKQINKTNKHEENFTFKFCISQHFG
jgi:hypothetical protein